MLYHLNRIYRYLIVSLVILSLGNFTANCQEKRALVIGIGNYPSESGWNSIHGDNDVSIIYAVLQEYGFKGENIMTLVDSDATYLGITRAFETLIENSNKNDIVYIQFSGHGQLITDRNDDEGDGFDESWVAYDAFLSYSPGVYEGQCHFIDDEISSYAQRLRNKIGRQGKIIVVSDACHSGGGARGDDEDIPRGSRDKFIIPSSQSKSIDAGKVEEMPLLFIAACKSYQTNYERKLSDGSYCGSLTYVISQDVRNFLETPYINLIAGWNEKLKMISKFPQTIVEEGMPNHNAKYIF